MTVAELKKKLAELPAEMDEATVKLEGCDCFGEWDGRIETWKKTKRGEETSILLGRDQ